MKPLNLNKPHMIILVGIPGAGKTFFAEHFSYTFNAPYVSLDILRSYFVSSSIDETAILASSNYLLDELFKTNRTIIYEGNTDARSDRQTITKKARDAGYAPLLVWVQTESASAKQRATHSTKEKRGLSNDEFISRIKHFTAPNVTEKAVVISGKHTYASQLKIVLKRLVEPRTEAAEIQSTIPRGPEGRHIAIIR
jgi:predicted kinase